MKPTDHAEPQRQRLAELDSKLLPASRPWNHLVDGHRDVLIAFVAASIVRGSPAKLPVVDDLAVRRAVAGMGLNEVPTAAPASPVARSDGAPGS
jgi:hypothetical protein